MRKIISAFIGVLFILFAFGSGSNNKEVKINIDNESEIKQYIIGKWSVSYYDLGTTWYDRYEITDTQIKKWTKFGEHEWKSEPQDVGSYYLSSVKEDIEGRKYRQIVITNSNAMFGGNSLHFQNGQLIYAHNNRSLTKGWEE